MPSIALLGIYIPAKDKEEIPQPSELKKVDVRSEYPDCPDGAFVNMVMVDVDSYARTHFEKSVKKTLSIPSWLNEAAMQANINFSQTLQSALKAQLKIAK